MLLATPAKLPELVAMSLKRLHEPQAAGGQEAGLIK